MTPKPARVLIIAGSDSSGGAGIQADIKTATALGAYAMTAITAVTVQDTMGVHGVHVIPADIVRRQIECVLGDIDADAIKTGVLVSAEIVNVVADALGPRSRIPAVLDSVMMAKGGARLLDKNGVAAFKQRLLPLASIVTPNAPEASLLTGLPVKESRDLVRAGTALVGMGAKAALVKGGHLEGDTITDALVTGDAVHLFRSARIKTTSTHGTGCTLATALATSLAQGFSLEDSVARARAFVQDAIRTAPGFGRGHGPLDHLYAIPPYEE